MKYQQLKQYIVEPTLKTLDEYSDSATQELILTSVVESGAGKYLHQIHGPALGIYQMEPATHDDCWKNYLAHNDVLAQRIKSLSIKAEAQEMIWNLRYATAMARVFYLRVPEALPAADDAHALAEYYKTHYNTAKGASEVKKSIAEYQRYIES